MRPATLSAVLPRIALFSDLDGTLLDGNNRLVLDAGDVARIASRVELILASSRTLVELGDMQPRLGVNGPLIAENGAVISLPPRWRGGRARRREILVLGDPATRLRPLVRQSARDAGVEITDQRDVLPDHARSLRRSHSMCVRNWSGPGSERFLAALRRIGLEAARSGEWITITRGADKGTAARAILARARRQGAPFLRSAAIGNAANDVPLLRAANTRLAIRNPRRGHEPELLAVPRVKPLSSSGTRAWREALRIILANGRP